MRAGRTTLCPARRPAGVFAALVAVLALAGCQVKVAVDTKVERDGHGTLSVGVGLDDKALSRVGALDGQVRLSDLAAAGWLVAPVQREADGLTWMRASKAFANATELGVALAEISGAEGMFRDFTFTRTEDGDTTYKLRGTIDPTKGMATFGDAELAARLGGDPFAGLVQQIEAEEGRPAADMVSFDVTAAVADAPATAWHPTLRDPQPTTVEAAIVDPQATPAMIGVVLLGVLAAAAIVIAIFLTRARRRFAPVSR